MNDTIKLINARKEQLSIEAAEAVANGRAKAHQLEIHFKPLWKLWHEAMELSLDPVIARETFNTAQDFIPRINSTTTSIALVCEKSATRVFYIRADHDSDGFPVIRANLPEHYRGVQMASAAALEELAKIMTANEAKDLLITILAKITK